MHNSLSLKKNAFFKALKLSKPLLAFQNLLGTDSRLNMTLFPVLANIISASWKNNDCLRYFMCIRTSDIFAIEEADWKAGVQRDNGLFALIKLCNADTRERIRVRVNSFNFN